MGNMTLKILIITSIIFFLFLGLYLYQIAADEKNNLLYQIKRAKNEKKEQSQQLTSIIKSIEPLKNEIQVLREAVARGGKEKSANVSQSDYPFGNNIEVPPNKKTFISGKPAAGKIKVRDTQNSLARLKDYLKNIEGQNNALKEKTRQLEEALGSKDKEILKFRDESVSLKRELEKTVKAQNELKLGLETSLSEEKVSLENQISALNDKLLSLSGDNVYLQKQTAQYQQEKSSLENELQRIKDGLEKQSALNDTFNKRVSELMSSLRDKENENLNIAGELEQLRKSKSALESELNEFKVNKMGNDNQSVQLNARIKEMASSYDSIRATVSQLSNFLAKKDAEITDKQNEIYILKGDLERSGKEKEDLILSLRGKEKNIFDLNVKLSEMQSQISVFQKELALTKENQRKTIKQLSEASTMNTSLQERLLDISKGLDGPSGLETDVDKNKADELRRKVEVKLDMVEGNTGEEPKNNKVEDIQEEIPVYNSTGDNNQFY